LDKFLKGGIIGFGKMGIAHSAILNSLENNSVKAICENSDFINSFLKKSFKNINLYKNFDELIDKEKLDYVFITSPNKFHKEHIVKSIESDLNFFVEKPTAMNDEEIDEILDVYQKHQKKISMVGFMMRYVNSFKKAKHILDQKIIGDVINFQATMYVSQVFKKGTGWRYDKKSSGGGVIMAHSSHLIDLLCWYLGYPSRIEAKCHKFYSDEIEDYGHIFFEYNDNKFGWIDCSWSADNYRTLTTNIKISGSNGEIRVGDDFLEVFLKDSIGDYNAGWHYFDKIDLYTPSAFDIGQDGYSDQNQDFIRKIQSNDPEDIKSNIYNGCIIQKIISKIYKSSSQNKYIEFNG